MENKSVHAELIEKIRSANNILLTVGQKPTIDDLLAMNALARGLRQMNKKVTSLFSGQIPDKIRFLNPKFNSTVDKLRNFIICIYGDKTIKVNTKKDGNVTKINLETEGEISKNDLSFELGELKVDLVLVVGAVTSNDIDLAIMDGGVDASRVVFFSAEKTSGYSELIAELLIDIRTIKIDAKISNFLLTGIIDATEQFGNEKTSARTFQISARLLKFGADQQLIVENLRNAPNTSLKINDNDSILTEAIEEKPINLMSGISYEELLRQEAEKAPQMSIYQELNEQQTKPVNNTYSDLDLTIPPTPVLSTNKSTKVKTVLTDKLPHPKAKELVDLPPPPPTPDFNELNMPPNTDFDSEIAPPPAINTGDNKTLNINPNKTTDPNQFQIPL